MGIVQYHGFDLWPYVILHPFSCSAHHLLRRRLPGDSENFNHTPRFCS